MRLVGARVQGAYYVQGTFNQSALSDVVDVDDENH
jgi:hypothetical protein